MEVEVPCYFLCPITLQMMRDPVTLPTGITYDRDGIERWLLTDGSRKLVAAVPGAVDVLAAEFVASAAAKPGGAAVCDEALEVVSSLQLSEHRLARVISDTNGALVGALASVLRRPNAASRARAALLLQNVTAAMSPGGLVSLPQQVFAEVVQLIRDEVSRAATKAALHVLVGATSWGRNRAKAVDAGAVPVLVGMLLENGGPERRACELALGALDRLCGCAEGRAELVAHGAGVVAVGGRAVGVSDVATDRAVRVLRSVARHAATPAVVQEMAQTGVVGTLCAVALSEQCAERTRERARETLRRHARAWRTSPCLHHHLQANYPC